MPFQKSNLNTFAQALLDGRFALLVLIALVTGFWWPALHDGKAIILQGDSASHGLPLVWLHAQALAGKESLLWSSRVGGGFPIFAESQGGFANPLAILVRLLFEPAYSLAVLRWLDMIIGGSGVYCICRLLRISRWSAVFSSLVVTFSGGWMAHQENLPISSTLAFAPWLIAAAEYWIRRPTIPRAVLMSILATLLVFAGYPQIPHGVALYLLASLLPLAFQAESRHHVIVHRRIFLVSGGLAVLMAIGLSALQLFPLLELASQSHRSAGIALVESRGQLPFSTYIEGLLLFVPELSLRLMKMPSVSCILAMLLTGLFIAFRTPPRIAGHILGAFVLFNCGLGSISPAFRFLYDHHLVPGLHYFRSAVAYLQVMIIGFAVAAAYFLDAVSSAHGPGLRWPFKGSRLRSGIFIITYSALFVYAVCRFDSLGSVTKFPLLGLVICVPAYVLSFFMGKRSWFPLLVVMVFGIEIIVSRIGVFNFYDKKVFEKSPVVSILIEQRDLPDFKTMDHSLAILGLLLSPSDPGLASEYRRFLSALGSFPAALEWNIPSISGALSLPLARHVLITPVIGSEVLGGEHAEPGYRLIDILGVRYVSRDSATSTPGLTQYFVDMPEDPYRHVFIYRNDYAKPRFQVYWNAEAVDTPEQALAGLKAAKAETLFVERHRGERALLSSASCAGDACAIAKPKIGVIEAGAMRYRVSVEMPRAGWLFLADAYYPGWEATVNGARRPLYAAQVLGKAVPLDAGRNEVTIRYVPWSFYIGAGVSALTLLLVAAILWRGRRRLMVEA